MFAKNLKQLMSDKCISQTELAARIGKGKSSVSQYLSGKNVPKDDVKEKIAEVLGCSIHELNYTLGTGEEPKNNISVAECAKILGKSEQFVRVALQTGAAPFGIAVKNKSRYDYHISPKKLNEYINA
jgi:transcriptional regulator with XRE-family HTH domain